MAGNNKVQSEDVSVGFLRTATTYLSSRFSIQSANPKEFSKINAKSGAVVGRFYTRSGVTKKNPG